MGENFNHIYKYLDYAKNSKKENKEKYEPIKHIWARNLTREFSNRKKIKAYGILEKLLTIFQIMEISSDIAFHPTRMVRSVKPLIIKADKNIKTGNLLTVSEISNC